MSPYGVDKKLGGDNPSNVKWMEKCADSVMRKGDRPKSSAIAICKSQMKKMRSKKSSDSSEHGDEDMSACMKSMMDSGKAHNSEEARKMCEERMSSIDEPVSIDYDVMNDVLRKLNFSIRKLMLQGKSFNEAKQLTESFLGRADYDIDVFKSIIDNEVT